MPIAAIQKILPRPVIYCGLLTALFATAACSRSHRQQLPPSPPAIDFVYWNPSAKNVFLAGDFNGWNTASSPMKRSPNGEWKTQVVLKPGRHEYKFIADGRWIQDPANLDSTDDLFGGHNSAITVNPVPHQDGLANRRQLASAVHRLFLEKNFSALEKQADELRRNKTRLLEGRWELPVFYEGVYGAGYAGDDPAKWREISTLLDAWHQQFPNSITEPVARAHNLVDYAWQARGTGWSSEVTTEGGHLMRDRLAQARACLEAAAKLPSRCPEWYVAMQSVALGQGWKRPEDDRLFEEAVAREPTYYQYYFDRAYYLTPRWFGDRGEWEHFAEDAPARYDKQEGQALYTRIAWSKDFLFGNLLHESAIQWPRMRDGFRDILRQWPESIWNKNNFCRFACYAGDHSTAAGIFDQLGDNLDYDVWHSRNQFEAARRWAKAAANSVSVRPEYRLASRYATRATAIACSFDEKAYYAGYGDGMLVRWDPEAGREVAPITQFDSGILKIAVAPGGKLIAVALDQKNGTPGSVKIIDAITTERRATIGDWKEAPFALAWSADGSTLAVVGGKSGTPGDARIWDANSGQVTAVPWPAPKHLLISVALSPDGRLLMTNDDANVRVWDLREKKFVFKMQKDAPELVLGVAFSPDGKQAVAVCSRDSWQSDAPGLLIVWNTTDWTETKRITLGCGAQHIVFSPDGSQLAATRRDNTITIWNAKDWKQTTEFLPMGGYVAALTHGPDGKSIAVATFSDGFSVWRQTPDSH